MRNGLLPVEEACFCEEEGTGTDGCDARALASGFRDPGDKVGIVTAVFLAPGPPAITSVSMGPRTSAMGVASARMTPRLVLSVRSRPGFAS